MTPEREFGERRYPELLERLAAGDKAVAILLAKDWLPIESYRPSTDYVFLKHLGDSLDYSVLNVGSRGWHPQSYWYGTDGKPLGVTRPHEWKPIDWSGHKSVHAYLDTIFPPPPPWVRPPEQVFEPGPSDVRLTNEPYLLLQKLCGEYALKELIGSEWDSFKIQHVGAEKWERITCRPVDRLREQAFIARVGTLPPGRPKKMIVYDWTVTDAGRGWLAANPDGWRKPPKPRKAA